MPMSQRSTLTPRLLIRRRPVKRDSMNAAVYEPGGSYARSDPNLPFIPVHVSLLHGSINAPRQGALVSAAMTRDECGPEQTGARLTRIPDSLRQPS
ncbi:hypothetical protein EVAR_61195_1 [Eumeta japonica]|uniref:Uncharacterized protein n=1 Tax=Eumeta variegata TaxID=151549 RepID=A0A4C1YY12_EUMVA|nr:hypothetical protein EVAR_61195_1 [Eumeta japonica]